MDHESTFRIAVAVVIVLATTIAVYHRASAASGSPPVSRRKEGWLVGLTLRCSGLVLWMATLAYLIAPSLVPLASFSHSISMAVRWVGVLLAVVGLVGMQWTLASLGRNLTDTVETRQNAKLVTDGPYRWVQHPYYVTAAILMLATTLMSANAIIGISGLFVIAILALRTPQEEQCLLERFGPAYQAYRNQTGRFVPKLRKPAA